MSSDEDTLRDRVRAYLDRPFPDRPKVYLYENAQGDWLTLASQEGERARQLRASGYVETPLFTQPASAPAGDGVEDRDALAERLCAARFPTTVARHPDYYRVQLTEESRERWRVVADAALARPRAAVGEREAWELPDLRDLHRDIERVRDHDLGNDRMRDLLRGAMDMLKAADVEYAALQSPPAKVEG